MAVVLSTSLDGVRPCAIGGECGLLDAERLLAVLADHGGSAAVAMFARPEIHRGQFGAILGIDWHSEADGDHLPVTRVSAEVRAAVRVHLRRGLQSLQPLLARNNGDADLVRSALNVPSVDAILVAGERPLLTNWGMIPRGIHSSADRLSHFDRTMGAVSGVGHSDLLGLDGASVPAKAAPGPGSDAAPVARAPSNRSGRAVAIALLGLGIFALAYLFLPGTLVRPQADLGGQQQGVLELYRQSNQGLESALETLIAAREGFACSVDPGAETGHLPLLLNPETAAVAANSLPDDVPPDTPIGDVVRTATVLVINGDAIGTGFFVAPGLVLTNAHVVRDADEVGVANVALGEVRMADVVDRVVTEGGVEQDYALLHIDDPDIPALRLSGNANVRQPVMAAGFPGSVVRMDDNYRALRQGEMTAIPELVLIPGSIIVMQNQPSGHPLIAHNARIGPGNSGGPLVDACGSVVGINTFVSADEVTGYGIPYALGVEGVITFLERNSVAYQAVEAPCQRGAN